MYSNVGIELLAERVVGGVGMPFASYLAEAVAAPLLGVPIADLSSGNYAAMGAFDNPDDLVEADPGQAGRDLLLGRLHNLAPIFFRRRFDSSLFCDRFFLRGGAHPCDFGIQPGEPRFAVFGIPMPETIAVSPGRDRLRKIFGEARAVQWRVRAVNGANAMSPWSPIRSQGPASSGVDG